MPRTQKSLTKNLSKLTTTKKSTKKSAEKQVKTRKTRIDKKPEYTVTNSVARWQLSNGNGTIYSMPWHLEPNDLSKSNKAWFRCYEDACKHIAQGRLRAEEYTLWKLKP